MLTHEDASVNYETSRSMRTMAFVTMAFLPATFLAALFAVPLLDWEGEGGESGGGGVVRAKFWIFWALAIPCTLLVFALWAVVDKPRRVGTGFRRGRRYVGEVKERVRN